MSLNSPNPTRFHQLALGKFDNFKATSAGIIAVGDSAPSVSLYSLLYADTNGTLTIDNFTDSAEGQIVGVVNRNSGVVNFSGTNIYNSDSSGLSQNENAFFIKNAGKWFEISKRHSQTSVVTTAAAGDTTPSVKNASILVFNSAGGITISKFDDGIAGQIITVINKGAGSVTIANNVSNIMLARTAGNFVMIASDSTAFSTPDGTTWYNVGIAATAI